MTGNSSTIRDFAVRREDFSKTTFVERPLGDLAPGQALLRVDRYALTANNLSYATAGDALGYWKFFPADDGWGRLPCFAFADVERSTHDGVPEGGRYFGYFPMSTRLVVEVDRAKGGTFVDNVEHRRSLPMAYNQYVEVGTDPFYQSQYEDAQMLLKPLFMTSFLIDDFLATAEFFGASAAIVTSASSKTSLALAFSLQKRGLAGGVIGLTSDRNRAFVESTGFYDRVVSYDEIENLDSSVPVVAVDMAGSADVTRRLHEHFKDNMKHDAIVGATHWRESAPLSGLPGAAPAFFFAPTQIKKRAAEWGPIGLVQRIGEAWNPFVETTGDWLEPKRGYGDDAVADAYARVVRGDTSPNEGFVLSLWPKA
ncbi:MAG: DUF2855 family protein [Myxococcota bacterium]